MKKFLLPLAVICALGFAGCSDNTGNEVKIDINRDLAAISQDAAAANLKTADEMIAAYGKAIAEMNAEADMLGKEMNKIKMADIAGAEAQNYQKRIAAKRELAKKCEDAVKLFEARKSALEAADKGAAKATVPTEIAGDVKK